MGVRGLKTLVFENRKRLLKPAKLRDTKLIIDGHGICHILLYNLNPNSDYFGGIYDEFANMCEDFFEMLSNCKIEPYVFFDGVHDEEKIKTTLHRLEERTGWQKQLSEGGTINEDERMLPILSYETFKSVLVRKKIRHRMCTWESDPQMAAFAVDLDCPILTCDSDFFIYNIPKGVIVVDHLDATKLKKCKKYFEVDMYHISNFMFQIGLDNEDHGMIALLATILRDQMSGFQFRHFFSRAKLPEKCNDLIDTTDKKKVIRALGWLQSKQTLDNAIRDLVSYFRSEEEELVKRYIMESIEEFTNIARADNSSDVHQPQSRAPSARSQFQELPKWFVEYFRKCKLPVAALATMLGRPVIFPPQISVMTEPSPYHCCSPAREFMYRLLLGSAGKCILKEYDRNKDCQLKPQYVFIIGGSESIPSLDEIPKLGDEIRFSVLVKNLHLPLKLLETFSKDVFSKDEHLLIVAIFLFLQNLQSGVDGKRFLYTLLACFIINGKFESCREGSDADTSPSRRSRLGRFFEVPSEINPATFECRVVHVFSQFQCCLQTVINLSQILLLSPDAGHLVTGFNGTFVHNLYRELCSVQSKPEHFMRKLLDRCKQFETFDEIRRRIEEITADANSPHYCFKSPQFACLSL